MNAWIETWNAAAAAWFNIIVAASWQGGIALAVVWLVSRFVSRIPPSCKVWLWRLAFLKLLVALVWLTPVALPVLPQESQNILISEPVSPLAPSGNQIASDAALPCQTIVQMPPVNWRAWLLLVWCAGLFCGAARLARHGREARRLIADARPLSDPAIAELIKALVARFELRRAPVISASADVSSPMLVGILRPHIILPSAIAASASQSRLELMLAHELAHCRRKDLLWLWLFTITETLFFFHPLVWLARREWTLATEAACDELALRVTRDAPREYGEMLVDLVAATRQRSHAGGLIAVGMIENANTLKRRLKVMITTRTRLGTMSGIALIAIAAVTLVPWKLTAQETDAEVVAKLKEENARLREQLEAVRKGAEQMHADAEQLRKRVTDERETDASAEVRRFEQRQRRSDLQSQEIERAVRAIDKMEAELGHLQRKYTEQHPDVRRKSAELEKLKQRLVELDKGDPRVSVEPPRKTKMGFVPADARAVKHHEQQREMLRKEVELAERHAEFVRKALENGKEIPASLLAAQREVLDVKLQLARLSGSKADQRAVLFQQLDTAEGMLKEYKKRVEVGTISPGAEIPFEREVLRIRRELYALDGPDLR